MSSPGTAPARLLVAFLGVALALGTVLASGAAPAAALPAAPGSPPPVAYISVDADSGRIIAAKNEHAALPPASTIKPFTALVALSRLPLTSTVPVSALAAGQPAMKINMTAGSTWKLDDALHALLIVSANDAAFAIAERVGGTVDGFDLIAQEEAKRLGMVDTVMTDPSGLDGPTSFKGGSRTSAYDLAIVARNALAVPEIANTAKTLHYEFTDPNGVARSLTNHNKGFLTSYPGATGLKTGFTNSANRTLVTSATRDGHTCIAVNLGTWDDTGWAGYLLDQCFAAGRDATGTGVTLPPVRIVTADQRLGAYEGLPAALGRPALAGSAAAAAVAPPPSSTTTTTAPSRVRAPGDAALAAAESASRSSAESGGSTLGSVVSLRNAAIFIVVFVLALFLLRRRAVRRQRARRIARQRALDEKRRRRMIDVVELHDRESGAHVRLMRTDERR